MNIHWLMRMRRWVQHPPSKRQMMIVGAVVALCLILVATEQLFGWPESLTPNGSWRPRLAP